MTKKIGILTSGGDSPGMNTLIYNITNLCFKNNFYIYGIYNGFKGLYENNIKLLNYKNIFNISNIGGTFLKSSRFPELKNYEIRKKIIKKIKKKIDILIVIGGEGSYKGAFKLNKMNLPCINIPGTIDNDIYGTDYTVGYFTALENIIKAIDNLKDTSLSHNRISILEVMGRKCGNLALSASLACSCKSVIIPEIPFNKKKIIKNIKKKNNNIIIITENIYNIKKLAIEIEKKTNIETRATSLGHIQRGGRPVSLDRILASKMAFHSIELIKKNKLGQCIGIKNEKIIHYILKKNKKKKINKNILNIIKNFP